MDFSPIYLTLHLAVVTTLLLLLIAVPLAWWLASNRSTIKTVINTLVTMPLVLPPTVIGFYLLIFLGPNGLGGEITQSLGLGTLPFTFSGLVVASMLYSLPFAVQPLVSTFKSIGPRPREVAATLGASPLDCFISVVLPLARGGLLTAMVLTFAHTIGEFGVVLMIGGNIPGETQVLSVAIYDHVEALEYRQAHILAAGLLIFSFAALLLLQLLNKHKATTHAITE